MSYANHESTIYAVYWESLSALKIGITFQQRWRAWELLGGKPLWTGPGDYDAEALIHLAMLRRFRPRWETRDEMRAAIGGGGGGWMEFYTVTIWDLANVYRQVDKGMHGAMRRAYAEQCTYVRTYVRTSLVNL